MIVAALDRDVMDDVAEMVDEEARARGLGRDREALLEDALARRLERRQPQHVEAEIDRLLVAVARLVADVVAPHASSSASAGWPE